MEELKARIKNILSARKKKTLPSKGMKKAAVLLLILEKDGAPCILFTKRTETVAHHKGEISFPGGVQDKRDKSLLETALRETREEIGIPAEKIEILGELDDNVTKVTNFHLTSYVGMLLPPVTYKTSNIEIERMIEVPLAVLQDPSNFREEIWEYGSEHHPIYFYTYGKDVIWGATARILKHFLDITAGSGLYF